jgi:hypothetical protein
MPAAPAVGEERRQLGIDLEPVIHRADARHVSSRTCW